MENKTWAAKPLLVKGDGPMMAQRDGLSSSTPLVAVPRVMGKRTSSGKWT